jgi:enterochelin esterase-like enzyme
MLSVETPPQEMLRWHLPDPEARWAAVRLQQHAGLSRQRAPLDFSRQDGDWVLEVARPPIDRLEYQFELYGPDGSVETVPDPANPKHAVGVFGEPSLIEFPEYRAPAWLDSPPGEWDRVDLAARGRGLRDVPIQLCSPAGVGPEQPLPLLVAHDGGELDALARVTHYAAAMAAARALPPFRIALLSPLDRDNWYSGSTAYGRTLAQSVLPRLRHEVAVAGPVVGYGASLGALSMLATQLRHPGTFGGLGLASGSFFHPSDDAHESSFRRYWRVVDRVTDVLQGAMRVGPESGGVPWMRVSMVCGTVEENLANNRRMASALDESGHGVTFAEFRDAHNFTAWRDAFDPHLTALLADLWG